MFVQKTKSNIATVYIRRFKVKPVIEVTSLKTVEEEVSILATKQPKQIGELRDLMPIETYEADVKFSNDGQQ